MKKITKKAITEFIKTARDMYYTYYFGDQTQTHHEELNTAIDMLLLIDALWSDLMRDTDEWFDGDQVICKAIGETVVYWNTDVVDQLYFIDDLEKLALSHYEKQKYTTKK